MEEYKYKYGDIVRYDVNGLIKGNAKIVGVANNGAPIIGVAYILEDLDGNFPNKVYPYSHFSCFEQWINQETK